LRILIVEDEPLLLEALSESLREEGYAVDTASDGEEGLYKARSWDYNLILLDIMLPRLDGWSLLEKIRKTKRTPILVLTAKDDLRDRIRGLDGGADDYLVKPFETDELLARARAIIRRSAGQANGMLRVGAISIDTASRTVKKDGQKVSLTAREYSILEILALNQGKLMTRMMLYEQINDETDATDSKVIEVHVSHLRRKLGKDSIKTRRGQGYMIEAQGSSGRDA